MNKLTLKFLTIFTATLICFSVNALASDYFILNENSYDDVSGYSVDPKINFWISFDQDQEEITMNLELNAKTIKIRKGLNEENPRLSILGTSNNDGTTFLLQKNDRLSIEFILSNIDFNRVTNEQIKNNLFSILNLLDSWPVNLLASCTISNDETTTINDKGDVITVNRKTKKYMVREANKIIIPDGQTLDPPPPEYDYLCTDVDKDYKIEGHILYVNGQWNPFTDVEMWTETFSNTVGGEKCFGRCGRGCIGDGAPNNKVNKYTQRCFNHDGCVDKLGPTAYSCNIMFTACINDFFFAVPCD